MRTIAYIGKIVSDDVTFYVFLQVTQAVADIFWLALRGLTAPRQGIALVPKAATYV